MKTASRFVVAIAALAALVLPAATGAAAGSARIADERVEGNAVTFTISAPQLPPAAGLDAESLRVSIAGSPVKATAVVGSEHSLADIARAMLVVDTSGSMNGAGLRAAKAAVGAFADAAPAGARVGLMTFSDRPHVLVAPTLDRQVLLRAVDRMSAAGNTALYDAVTAALDSVGPAGIRKIVVVSDGGDTVSRTSLTAAVASLRAAGVSVEVVALHTAESDTPALRELSTSTGGRFVTAAGGGELAQALRSSARSYAKQLVVRAEAPAALHGRQILDVSVDSTAGALTATSWVDLSRVKVASSASRSSSTGGGRLLLLGLACVALSLLLGFFALMDAEAHGRRRMRKLVDRYSTSAPTKGRLTEESVVARTALDLAGRVARSQRVQDRLAQRLERAAVSLTPSEWILIQAGLALGLLLLLVVLGFNAALAVVLSAIGGPALGHVYLGMRASRRRAAFVAMLPDTLQLLAGSLSAGYSLAQAMDGVVREGSQPVASEIGRALAESQLGVPIEHTLESVANRMQSEDFHWVVLAIQIQRQVGGNLADVLMTVAHTMRERVQLRRHVRALSAEGRLSAYILIALPIFLTLYMLTVRRDYLRPLYTTRLGLVMIGFGAVLMVIGSFVMKKMATVEV